MLNKITQCSFLTKLVHLLIFGECPEIILDGIYRQCKVTGFTRSDRQLQFFTLKKGVFNSQCLIDYLHFYS